MRRPLGGGEGEEEEEPDRTEGALTPRSRPPPPPRSPGHCGLPPSREPKARVAAAAEAVVDPPTACAGVSLNDHNPLPAPPLMLPVPLLVVLVLV